MCTVHVEIVGVKLLKSAYFVFVLTIPLGISSLLICIITITL